MTLVCNKVVHLAIIRFTIEEQHKLLPKYIIKNQHSRLILPLSLPNKSNLFNGNTDMQVRTPLKVSERSLVLENDASWSKDVWTPMRLFVVPDISSL